MSESPTKEQALALLRETVGREKAANSFSMSDPKYWQAVQTAWMRGEDWTAPITLQDALQLSAVLLCLDILSQDIAKTPLYLVEDLPNGGKRRVKPKEHPVAGLLARQPNRFHTWFEFKQMVVLHLGITENAFIAKEITPAGDVRSMIPVVPWRVQPLVMSDYSGFLYEIGKDTTLEKVLYRQFSDKLIEDEMIHVRMRMYDGLFGYSNMLAGAKTMTLAQELVDYQTRMFRNDGTLRGVFEQGKAASGGVEPMDPAAMKNLREQLAENMFNLRRHSRPLVLEDGLTFKQISMTAEQSEMAKARDSAIVEIARTFRVPPHKVYHLVNIKYENMDTMEQSYVGDTLMPICIAIEERLKVGILSEQDQDRFSFEFDREALTLNDVQKQAEMMKVMLGNGAMTIDEARARRSLNPLPNDAGKGRLIPTTYMLVDDSNKVIVAAAGVDPELAKQQADQAAKTAADAAAAADATSTADQQTDAAKGAVPTVPPLRH